MICTTQMMASKAPKLFYLFRRAFGFSCFLLVYSSGFGQIFINGNAVVLGSENLKSGNTIIYISEGTYIHNSAKPESATKKKSGKNSNKIFSIQNKKKSQQKNLIAQKPRAKPVPQYHYSSTDKNQISHFSHLQKIGFVGNFQDYHQKYFEKTTNWNSTNNYRALSSKMIIKTFKESISYFFNDYTVRPPPYFL